MAHKKIELKSDFSPAGDQVAAIAGLIDGLNKKMQYQTLLGVTGSGKTFTVAHVIEHAQRPTLIMAPNKTLAAQLYGEMREFFPNNAVEYFVSYYDYYQPEAYVPSSDTFIEKDASINEHIEQMRLSATKALLERKDVIIVATVSAIYGLGDPNAYLSMMLHLSVGTVIDQRSILRRLAELQYTRNDVELHRGTFRVRGDIIDVFPAASEKEVVRIALFGDEIESLSYFDSLTGEVFQSVQRLTIHPKTHYATPREKILEAVEAIKIEQKVRLEELYQNSKLVEAQRLKERVQFDIEMMVELGYCNGIENYSRHLTKRNPGDPPPCLLDYLPRDALVILDESHVLVPQLRAMYLGDRSRKSTLVEYGFRLPSAMDNRPLKFEEFEQIAPQTIYVSATPGDYEGEKSSQIVKQIIRPTGLLDPLIEVRPASLQVDDVLEEIHARAAKNERVLITTLTKKMSENLCDYLATHKVRVRYLHSDIETVERVEIIRDLRLGVFDVLIGINLLREGLDMPEVSLVAIFDADKEGFLRSTRSLIQTMGRAARNSEGKVILYAERVTRSMQEAMTITINRRQMQHEHNEANGIIPTTIRKGVGDVMQGARFIKNRKGKEKAMGAQLPVVQDIQACLAEGPLSLPKMSQKFKQWEERMYQYATDLQFEEAAAVRDALERFKIAMLKS